MGTEEIRQLVTGWVVSGIQAWNLANAQNLATLETENRIQADQGKTKLYVDLAIANLSESQAELGGSNVLVNAYGQIRWHVAVPENSGVAIANRLNEFLRPYLERKKQPGMETGIAEIQPKVPGNKGWVYFPVILNYRAFRFVI